MARQKAQLLTWEANKLASVSSPEALAITAEQKRPWRCSRH